MGSQQFPMGHRADRWRGRESGRTAWWAGVLAAMLMGSATGAEWTHYRGPTHDGVYAGPMRTNWAAAAPKRLWRISMGPALSSLSISSGRAFTQARRTVSGNDREFLVALDAGTGKELWSANLDIADYPDGGVGDDDGPRSTPVVAGDRVYVLTSYLRLYCFEAATGRQVWKRDFPAELGATVVDWQNAASPIVVGDRLYLNANTGTTTLTAVRTSDGTTIWRKHAETMTQATPVLATVAGVEQLVFFARSGLVSIRPDTGDLLWRFAFPYSTSTAASPVVDGDMVYCSAAYSSGSGVVRLTAGAGGGVTASQLWKTRSFNMNHWATGVAHGGHIYSIAGQGGTSLRCIQTDKSTEKWRVSTVGTESVGYGSILKAAGSLFVVNESGQAVLVEPNPTAYHELAHFQAVEGKTWNSPALNEGVLYIRSTTEIAAWDLAPPLPPSAPLRVVPPRLDLATGRANVTVRTTDGSPISSTRAGKISLVATGDPTVPLVQWQSVDSTAELVEGVVEMADPWATNAFRFYRAREQP